MSKLTSRLPNLGYLGHEVKSRELTVVAFIHKKTNQSLLNLELYLVHITTQ